MAQAVKSALPRHLGYARAGLTEQSDRIQQAQLHPQSGYGKPKPLMKNPVKMPSATTETAGQLANGGMKKFTSR